MSTGAGSTRPRTHTGADLIDPEPGDDAALSRRLLLLGAGTGLAFAALAVAVATQWEASEWFDHSLHSWIVVQRPHWSVDLANVLTWGGATILTVPALVLVGAAAANGSHGPARRVGSGVLLAAVGSLGMWVGLTINAWINGQRPDAADWAGLASGPTFPSGHTTSATIFAACCVWAFAPRCRTRAARVALCIAAGAYALAVGLTRVWLGVHWPTDVLGGWLFGISWTALASGAFLVARRRWRGRGLSAPTTS